MKKNIYKNSRMFWKVSVYDENKNIFIVKKCSLTKNTAKKLTDIYMLAGFIARSSPHIKR